MVNAAVSIALVVSICVTFVQLCKLDGKDMLRTFCIMLKLFGLVTLYGYFFEPSVVDVAWFKCGVVSLVTGISFWFMADRRMR